MDKLMAVLFLITTYLNSAAYKFYCQKKDFGGTFITITKSRYCELVKSYSVFEKDHSFKFYRTCNGEDYKQFTSKNVVKGHWTMTNDSIVNVSIEMRPSMKFKILSALLKSLH